MEILGSILLVQSVSLLKTALQLVVGHPFDYIKTILQTDRSSLKGLQVAKVVLRDFGLTGFYKGMSMNALRLVTKNMYRDLLRPMFKKKFSLLTKNSVEINMLTGLSMAITDVILLNPFQRIKVFIMTAQRSVKLKSILGQMASKNLIKQLYKGLPANLARGVLSWTSFLTIQQEISREMKQVFAKANYNSFSAKIYNLLAVGVLGAIVNTSLTMPFDTIKSINQMNSAGQESLIRSFGRIKKERGIGGFYWGYKVRLPHYACISVIQAYFIPLIDQIWGISRN